MYYSDPFPQHVTADNINLFSWNFWDFGFSNVTPLKDMYIDYTIIPLYHYTIIPLYHYTIIPLYHNTIIP